jgi:predicted nucleic acid-binding protein
MLVDTNIILYLIDGNKKVMDILDGQEVYMSFISELELLSFSDLSSVQANIINLLLDSCEIIGYNNRIKQHTIQIRKDNKLKLPDSIILATAKFLNIPVFTGDKRLAKVKGYSDVVLFEEE